MDMEWSLRDWVPQLEILTHTSTGGFMNHRGWNSCMESVSMAVPVAPWAMHSPANECFSSNKSAQYWSGHS